MHVCEGGCVLVWPDGSGQQCACAGGAVGFGDCSLKICKENIFPLSRKEDYGV
jgi:hypothetical protein